MNTQRTYFRPTTAQQRRLLFETWEATGSIGEACRKARVCRRTFYRWKKRFDEKGYAGIETPESHAPDKPRKASAEVEAQVIEMRRQQAEWGKQRIADELAKANGWVPVVCPNTVRRILEDAGQWPKPVEKVRKEKFQPAVRTAERAGQTLNADLCFVPATHEAELKLPAVSGSSGHLVIERPVESTEPDYPGLVFADKDLDYGQAMQDFVRASQEQAAAVPGETVSGAEKASLRVQKQALRQEEARWRSERRGIRQRRQQEDAAWKQLKADHQKPQVASTEASSQAREAEDKTWHSLSEKRREAKERRKTEDQEWRQQRLSLRERWSQLPIITAWIAVLVIIDNCTRQCLGLPVFVVGQHVTAEMIVAALRELLPPELQFLITDRGTHFMAKAFQELVRSQEFVHVLIARHRPESNGIAERFVRTFKEWLKGKSWANDKELAALVRQFLAEYNDRPHQGLPSPGLSPNEFARRLCIPSA